MELSSNDMDQAFHDLGNALQKVKSASSIAHRSPENAMQCFDVIDEAVEQIETQLKSLRDSLHSSR
ncbi:hypothetical protein [Thioclava sp. GXIMD2076]|uniref:Uncharacterized protein n=1 Tax=Thioclava kandeliae TaxID=3070818 RepID=A0ABV1SE43_9RHOB